jgi:uncharacterized protein YkwD
MKRTLSCLTLSILLSFISPHLALAQQTQNNASFYSFLKNYLIAYNNIDAYNKQVLAAATQIPTPQPTQLPIPTTGQNNPQSSPSLSDVSTYILKGVNEYRTSLGLSPVTNNQETCSFATIRAQEIANGFNHDGFYNRVNSHTIPYAKWSHAVENIAQAPDYKEVVTLWKNSPGHAANMRDNTPYVCIMQSGSYYAYEGMRP